MSITPEQLAASGSEEGHQKAFFCKLALDIAGQPYHPLRWVHHVPNGGSRGDTRATASKAGALMRALGVKKGVLDVFFPLARGGYHGLYLEFKSPDKKGELSEEQHLFMGHCAANGYCAVVVDDWLSAITVLYTYCNMTYSTVEFEALRDLNSKFYVDKAFKKYNRG